MPESPVSKILFVCTGNTCRSPMAEGLARYLCRSLQGWEFASAGVFARDGQAASPPAVEVMRESGVDISGHRSRQVTPELLEESDFVITLTHAHSDVIKDRFPGEAAKIHTLHHFSPSKENKDVMDPFGGSVESYRKTRDEIESALSDLILSVITPSLKSQQEKL